MAPTRTLYEVDDLGMCPSRSLQAFGPLAVGAPPTVARGIVQFGAMRDDARRALVAQLIDVVGESADEPQLLRLRSPGFLRFPRPVVTPLPYSDAKAGFVASIGSEDWWAGDIALHLGADQADVVFNPEGDGELLEIVTWGPSCGPTHEALLSTAREWRRAGPTA